MGSSLSGILAILFMNTLETRALTSLGGVPLFKRYVDDCFLLANDIDQAQLLFQRLNEQHNNINFEIESPHDNTLCLLDFSVKISLVDGPTFEFYRKPARKNLFVNYFSHLPRDSKFAFVRNEYLRIKQRCSVPATSIEKMREFDNTLTLNGYPDDFVSQAHKIRLKKQSRPKHTGSNFFYLKLPFIDDDTNRRIVHAFRKNGFNNIRIAHKTNTLRSQLNTLKKSQRTCTNTKCPMRDNNKCFRRNVVYKITCNICRNFYIGSTIRFLHTRVIEHLTNKQSSVFLHLKKCRTTDITIDIIGTDSDTSNIRLREALYIHNLKPSINNKAEREAFSDFLYV